MTKHTKGPWSAPMTTDGRRMTGYVWAHEPFGGIIATVAGRDFASNEERAANARLLAAGPELLDALLAALETNWHSQDCDRMCYGNEATCNCWRGPAVAAVIKAGSESRL